MSNASKKRKLSSISKPKRRVVTYGSTVYNYSKGYKRGSKTVQKYKNAYPFYSPKSLSEMKHFDVWITNTSDIPGSGNVAHVEGADGTNILAGGYGSLNRIASGSGVSDRIGSRIRMKHLHVRLNINSNLDISLQDGNRRYNFRCMIVYDRSNNKAPAAVGDLLAMRGSSSDFDNDWRVLPNKSNLNSRFIFLVDQHINVTTDQRSYDYEWKIPMSLQATYTSTNGVGTLIS